MNKKLLRVLPVIVLSLVVMLWLCACSKNGEQNFDSVSDNMSDTVDTEENGDMVLFENGKYKINIIVPALADIEVSGIRNDLVSAFKSKTGIAPAYKKDDAVEADEDSVELLLGETNRSESAAPDGVDEKKDSFFLVIVKENKLIINGSDSYQLSLAVDYFIENYLSGDKTDKLVIPTDLCVREILQDYTREYWELHSIPAYPQGSNILTSATYNCGATIRNYTAGGENENSSIIQKVKKTSGNEFLSYVAKLESFGFEREYSNIIEENIYMGLYDGKQRVYLTFEGISSNAKVLLDPTGMSLDEFGYTYTPKVGEQSVFYQYAIPMNGKGEQYPISGMLLIVKCADNSVIIVDGGDGKSGNQMNDVAYAGLDAFLHEITGTPTTEKVRISAWYMTHYHSDHILGFYEFLSKYSDKYTLERVIANFPTDNVLKVDGGSFSWATGIMKKWSTLINSKYPECKELKVHRGQDIHIADLTLRVLYTHEDLATDSGSFNSTDMNDTSTVIRIDNGQMSMLVLGDANTRTQSEIRRVFSAETFKSNIVQAAHHGMYTLRELYREGAPSVFYVPQSLEVLSIDREMWGGAGTYKQQRDYMYSLVGEENCYFAGNVTVGFAVVDGEFTKVYHSETVLGV